MVMFGMQNRAQDRRLKLTESQIATLRERLERGDTQSRIAQDLGVSQSLVSAINNGKRRVPKTTFLCSALGCEKRLTAAAKYRMCARHMRNARREGKLPGQRICEHPGCHRGAAVGVLCGMHNWRLQNNGDPSIVIRKMKCDGSMNRGGYRVVHVGKATLYEHRVVMERILGRKL